MDPTSMTTFKYIFDEMNFSPFSPKKDECDVCAAYKTKNLTKEVYKEHVSKKEEVRHEKENDKRPSNKVFTMDIQSVLLCPKSNVSALYYKTNTKEKEEIIRSAKSRVLEMNLKLNGLDIQQWHSCKTEISQKKGHQAGIEYDDSDSTDGSDNESLLEDRVVQSQAETQENIEDFEVVRLEDRQSVQAGNQVPHQEQLNDMPSTPKRNTSEGEQFLVPPKSSRKKKGKPTSTTENENITQEAFQMMKAAFHRSNGGTQVRDEYNIYGELVGHQIRSLSTKFAKVTAQKLINDILFNAKLGKYDYPSYPQRNHKQDHELLLLPIQDHKLILLPIPKHHHLQWTLHWEPLILLVVMLTFCTGP
ncbi:unnamed protein product [Acanthoscelides obtectus]|uniref:Uncharacterized protein n=1 Tax=Acanthoscelides obtectus TaxID=200917 RepID=A0A9P0L4H9_ACAOB|nr:unnamed protein product [Acanthoscelides obtectus]CAK1649261.1 hypothetical protein AOBTE_LOCUS16118 [Acanthoscelides obtectus]